MGVHALKGYRGFRGGAARRASNRHLKVVQRNTRSAVKRQALRIADEEFTPLVEYADDPAGFCRDILGEELWEKQSEIAIALRDNPRVAVPACYASGKTYLAAALLLWWMYTRYPALVVTTAPTGRQVKKLLWKYVRKLHRKAKLRLPGRLLQVELIIDDDWQAFGFSGSSGHSVQGIHEAANVLFIEDEAAGMDGELLEDFEGLTATEGSRHLKIGNPTVMDGPFWAACEDEKESKRWVVIPISAYDVPNVIHKKNIIPGLVTWEWVQDKLERFGEDSPFFWTKVKGLFWKSTSELVIPVEWAQAALDRWDSLELLEWEATHDLGPVEIAVDIGMTIDETVITKKHGRRIWVLDRFVPKKTPVLIEKIEYWALQEQAEIVRVDATGLGKTIPDILEERILTGESLLHEDVEIDAIVLGKKPTKAGADAFDYALDEAQWSMREAFDPDGPAPIAICDPQLKKQLSARSWTLNRKGKIKVDTKPDLKKKGIKSPNDADATMLHFHPKRAVGLGFAA